MLKRLSNTIETMTEAEFKTEAEDAFRAIFVKDDPFEHPFAPNVEARRILQDYFWYPEPPLSDAIIAAASDFGETGFYASITPRASAEEQATTHAGQTFHWYVPFSEFHAWVATLDPVALTIYSPQGKWGIMASYEEFALLGGTSEFVSLLNSQFPDLDSQVYAFLEWCIVSKERYDIRLDWIPQLLAHVYDKETAQQLLTSTFPTEYLQNLDF